MKIKPVLFLTLIVVLAASLAACAPAASGPGAAPVNTGDGTISVVGSGEAFGRPDLAVVQIGVESFAESVADATSQNEATVQAVLDAIIALDIASEDIQTSNYSLWAEQVYGERGPEGIAGYRVNNQVSVTVRAIDRVGEVIAAATEAGANSIHGIAFSVADPAALEAEAREAAIADAREKATSLAELSGLELGEINSITELAGQVGPVPLEGYGGGRVAAESAAPTIAPGELAHNVHVQVSFAIR